MSHIFDSVKLTKGLTGVAKERANVKTVAVTATTPTPGTIVSGYTLALGDRVLCTANPTNGIYVSDPSPFLAWDAPLTTLTAIGVESGDFANTVWRAVGTSYKQESTLNYNTGALTYAASASTLTTLSSAPGVLRNNGALAWSPTSLWPGEIIVNSDTPTSVVKFATTGATVLEFEATVNTATVTVSVYGPGLIASTTVSTGTTQLTFTHTGAVSITVHRSGTDFATIYNLRVY